MAFGIVVLLVVALGIFLPIALYVIVRAEHDHRETMDRGDAERVARRDTRDRDS